MVMPGIDINHEYYIGKLRNNIQFKGYITIYKLQYRQYMHLIFIGASDIAIEHKMNQLKITAEKIKRKYGINFKDYMLKYEEIIIPNI